MDGNQNVINSLGGSFRGVGNSVADFLPELLTAIVVLVIGWLLGSFLKRVVERLFTATKLDQALDKAGVDTLSERAGWRFRPGYFVGVLVKWFVIIIFIVVALDILQLDQVSQFFAGEVLEYLPKVVAAALIIMGGIVLSNLVSEVTAAGARAAGFGAADLIGSFTRYAMLVFAVLAALSELEIAAEMVQILFAGLVFGASLAFGLAFGLGGRDTAGRYVSDLASNAKGSTPPRV